MSVKEIIDNNYIHNTSNSSKSDSRVYNYGPILLDYMYVGGYNEDLESMHRMIKKNNANSYYTLMDRFKNDQSLLAKIQTIGALEHRSRGLFHEYLSMPYSWCENGPACIFRTSASADKFR